MEFISSPNRRVVPGRKISAIVIHYTASLSIEGTIAWFRNRAAQVSAHYVIGRDGRTVQMVKDADVAWHAGASSLGGVPNVNQFSLGIELVGTADSGFTDSQMKALYELLETLVTQYKIPAGRVVGHSTISPGRKIDPEGFNNQFNWTKTREVCAKAFPCD